MKQTLEPVLSKTLKPICPRDNHLMNYEAKGIYWKATSEDYIQTMASYHCNFMECGVRYDHMNGYFTLPERARASLSCGRAKRKPVAMCKAWHVVVPM